MIHFILIVPEVTQPPLRVSWGLHRRFCGVTCGPSISFSFVSFLQFYGN